MSRHLQRDIERLHHEVLTQAGRVEQMISDAVSALCGRRYDLIANVQGQDDFVDKKEVELEEECLKLIALHQPVAEDLRRIATIMKLNAYLERIADLACNIVERADAIQAFPYFPTPEGLASMAENATEMLRLALDAFVNSDSKTAGRVLLLEDRVDEQNREIIADLECLLRQDPTLVDPALQIFSAARHIEEVADHAENVAEEVIYMIDGEIIRHKHTQFIKRNNG